MANLVASHGDVVLRVENLQVETATQHERVHAVRGVSLALRRGRVLALVGESGSGKSMTARSIVRLLPPGATVHGAVWLGERDVLALSPAELRRVRGRQIALIFQNPSASLNPTQTVGAHLYESLHAHADALQGTNPRQAVTEALQAAGLAGHDAERLLNAYPFELSGGQQQRVALALAIVLRPAVLLADEITTALDVTTQARVLTQLRSVAAQQGQAVLLITHDLAVAATWADDLAVMHEGTIVEHGRVPDVTFAPQHTYTAALLSAQPRLRPGHRSRARVTA